MEDKNQTNTSIDTNPMSNGGSVPPTPVMPEVVPTPDASVIPATSPVAAPAIVSDPSIAEVTPMATHEVTMDTPTMMNEETPVVQTVVSSQRSQMMKQYGIAVLVVLLMAIAVSYVLIKQGKMAMPAFVAKAVEFVHPAPAAAVVNGVKISMADYIKNKTQIEQSATQGGADLTSATVQSQIKTQALDVLINTEVLRQAAVKAGVVVTNDQIKARYDEIVKSLQGEDKLAAKMKELGITKDSLLKDISSEILIQTYLAKAVDTSSIKVSADEIKTAYDQANTNPNQKLPPLAQVSSAIETQLKQTKEQDMINVYIQKLRDASKVETNV